MKKIMELRPYQKECVNKIIATANNLKILRQAIVMATGAGKCLAKGTSVLMFNGTIKKVENVIVGDLLMGQDSKPRTVLSLGKGRSIMYDIIPVKGESYRVNEAHILSLKLSRRGFDFPCHNSKIVNIGVKDYLKKSKYFKHRAKGYKVGVDFSTKDVPIDSYFLGLWLGDGCSRLASITSADKEVLPDIYKVAKKFCLFVRKEEQQNNKSCNYYLTTKVRPGRGKHTNPVLNVLSDIGVLNNKHIPLLYKANNRKIRIELLSGYLDADGSLSNKCYDYISVSKVLAMDIAYIARSLGLACYVKQCKKKSQNKKEGIYYRGSISGDTSILKCRIHRKKASLRLQKKDVLCSGIKVVKRGIEDYYGFQIDGNGLFLLGDFTVTHNTIVFGQLPSIMKKKGKKTLILAHREELLEQAKDKLLKIDSNLKIEIEQAERKVTEIDTDVVIASVPTIGRKGSKRIEKFKQEEFGLIIIDEFHHATAESYKNILRYFNALKNETWDGSKVLLGFTATPHRADHIGLNTIVDEIVFNYPLRQAIDDGYLANIKAFSVRTASDISKVKSRMGDFSDSALEEAVNNEERNKLIVETYQELVNNTKALVFAVDVQHTKDLCAYFNKVGISAKYVIGTTDKVERKNIVKEFKEGKIKILIGCGVFTEGYDEPSIETILMARPTKSSVLYSQMAGRGTRLTDTKKHLNLIDFVDNTGNNQIITLPSLFGCSKTLKGTKGKYVTEIADIVNEMKEVNPDYDYSEIDDWNDEERIEKVIKEINIFAQAEIPEEVKKNSNYSWEKVKESFMIKFPPNSNNKKFTLELKPNMLNQYEIKIKEYDRVTPNRLNGYSGWQKKSENISCKTNNLEDAFKEGDALVRNSFSEYSIMFKTKAKWRSDEPTEKQLAILKKFNIPIPKGISKGACSVLIGKKFNENKNKK